MINGMMGFPPQVQLAQLSGTKRAPMTAGEMSNQFGSILASVTTSEPVQLPKDTELESMQLAVAELLQMTSTEEVMAFLQEKIGRHLPEVIDGEMILSDEQLLERLSEMLPKVIDPNMESIDIRTLLQEMEQLFTVVFGNLPKMGISNGENEMNSTMLNDFLMQIKNILTHESEMFSNSTEFRDFLMQVTDAMSNKTGESSEETLSKEDLLTLLAVMQMVAIEGPKTDLTLKQEGQLHSFQAIMKSLGAVLTENSSTVPQQRVVTLPFMDTHIPIQIAEQLVDVNPKGKEQALETFGQSAQTMTAAVKLDGAQPTTENQPNSRAEQLMRELQNVFKRANLGQTGGTNRISIKLYPEHLGQLRIELLQTNGLLTARILASNALGKDMLESQLHQLRQAFLQQNVQVERIDISQMLTETPQHERDQAFGKQFSEQQEDGQNKDTNEQDEEPMSFSEYLIELEG